MAIDIAASPAKWMGVVIDTWSVYKEPTMCSPTVISNEIGLSCIVLLIIFASKIVEKRKKSSIFPTPLCEQRLKWLLVNKSNESKNHLREKQLLTSESGLVVSTSTVDDP